MPGIGNRTELPQATSDVGCSCCSNIAAAPPERNTADAEFAVEGLTSADHAAIRDAVTAAGYTISR